MTPPGAEGILIRRLQADDAAAFRALRLEAIEGEPTAFSAALDDERAKPLEWARAILTDGASTAMIGAFAGGDLIGMAGILFQAGEKRSHKALLWSVYVRPGFRRAGVARSLILAALDLAAGRARLIQCGATSTNHAALALYEALGFVRYGEEPKAIQVDGRFHDEALLWLDLTGRTP